MRRSDRAEGPVFLCDEEIGAASLCRPGGSLADPGCEVLHGLFRELRVGRHLEGVVPVAQGTHQEALRRIARKERRPTVAPLEQGLARIDAQAAGNLVTAVAL